MAVVIGGVIIIGLGLTMGAAGLRWLGVELHYPARLVAPVLLAVLETLLFLLFVVDGLVVGLPLGVLARVDED